MIVLLRFIPTRLLRDPGRKIPDHAYLAITATQDTQENGKCTS